MPRISPTAPVTDTVFQVVSPFAIWRNGVPEVYANDRLVMATDPVLKTHGENFVPVSERVSEQVQFMSAAPPVSNPVSFKLAEQEKTDG